jgi:cell division initiation protein
MKITPLDIQQMQFKVRLRGYDRREVEHFLEELALAVEDLTRENTALREKLSAVEEEIAGLKKTEATLMHAIVSTQALTDDLKQAAQRDAELIMKEAELKAGELLREARVELAGIQRELLDLQKQKLLAIERMRSTLRTFERLLEIESGDEEPTKMRER